MKALGNIWAVVSNLITLLVILGIFVVGTTRFEQIVFSLLVIIFTVMMNNRSTMYYGQADNWYADYLRYKHLRMLLKDESLELNKEREDRAYSEACKKNEEGKFQVWINMNFNGIFYLVAIFNLLRALLFLNY